MRRSLEGTIRSFIIVSMVSEKPSKETERPKNIASELNTPIRSLLSVREPFSKASEIRTKEPVVPATTRETTLATFGKPCS